MTDSTLTITSKNCTSSTHFGSIWLWFPPHFTYYCIARPIH